jgi:hypothetical protein
VNLTLIAVLVSAALAFGSAWQVQSWRYGAKETQRAEQIAIDQRAAFKAFERNQAAVITAQNNSARRAAGLRADADRARAGLDGLRDAAATSLRAAAVSLDACIAGATTASQLLNDSATAYQELAAAADGHVNDIVTLREGWPR